MKEKVKEYWNANVCGTGGIDLYPYLSFEYFQEVERRRYEKQPEIHAFAQFSRYHGKKVLEVGVGAGTDFVQWIRSSAKASGVDLTEAAICHTGKHLELLGLDAVDLRVADAENLPYVDNTFDLVYSWGVVHHSPAPITAIKEIVRVTKPGGTIKLMVYNRHSVATIHKYLYYGLLKGKPFMKIARVLAEHQESVGTRAFTFNEIRVIMADLPVTIVNLKAEVTRKDLSIGFFPRPLNYWAGLFLALLIGLDKAGWFMTIELERWNNSHVR